ncbi:hypothetical protein BSQ44_15260 [Aquibium oceanicum]|uniref:GGDEF domain-containing protein n=1 Tax=Aquibium oceanicum TaxID=1670800 RepID=A0A1L3ST01_9HYPH|nr:hypothetical protein BSQ44_15260 [Aquibium oceanicum]
MNWLDETHVERSIVDALTASICIIDQEGIIRAENDARRNFSKRNGGKDSYIGESYLPVVTKAIDGESEGEAEFRKAIREVLNGECHGFEIEYPCHSPDEQRWFLARVTPLQAQPRNKLGTEVLGAVITHQDISIRKLLELRLTRLAETDELTGLKNRRYLLEKIESSATKLQAGSTLALCLLDLDNFKEINDTAGHDAGDHILRQVAERISSVTSHLQSVVLARMGGDEFAVLLEVPRPWSVVPIAEEVFALLSAPYSIGSEKVLSAASIGIAFYPMDAGTPESLMKAADLALYGAKEGGRSRYVFFTTSLREEIEQRTALFTETRAALARNEFETHFQPIVRLKDKSLVGLEALVRWRHPTKGLISPAHFLPVLKDRHLGTAVSQAVMLNVIEHLSAWEGDRIPSVRVSVNLTADQLQNANFVEFLSRETSARAVCAD